MVTAVGVSATISIIDAAARVLKSDGVKGTAGRVAGDYKDTAKIISGNVLKNRDAVAQRIDQAGSAITSVTAQTNILSRAYIEEPLLGEAALPNVMKSAHEWYTAQIVSALHLSQMVSDQRTVQDVLGIVQTGHTQRTNSVLGNIVQRRVGQEAFLESYTGEKFDEDDLGLEAYYGPINANKDAKDWEKFEDRQDKRARQTEEDKRKFNQRDVNVRSVKVSDNRIGPMGELFEIKLSNPNGNGVSITVPVFIQMAPTIVPSSIAPRFIDMSVPPSLWQRWTMMTAGEMTFWKDFVLHGDYVRRNKALLKDRQGANALNDYLRTIAKKDKYALDTITDSLSSRQSSNLANSVVVLSEDTINQAKLDSGIDLHNPKDRATYFRNSYAMILIVMDTLHQRVNIYFNGLDNDINSSYSDFRPRDQNYDPKEFMTALQAFSTNNVGRMR